MSRTEKTFTVTVECGLIDGNACPRGYGEVCMRCLTGPHCSLSVIKNVRMSFERLRK
jgi:hypothetical protein